MAWHAYMQKYGVLNVGTRLESGFALIAYMISKALGGDAKIEDFMPHYAKEPADIQTFFAALRKGNGA
jgi:hypothetical protein